MEFYNFALMALEAVIFAVVLILLLHFRARIGIGIFMTVLGTMHFLETYLAAKFYVQLPFGAVSPGSATMFAGKLLMILLLYIKEDATTVRQLIYGLLIGFVRRCIAVAVRMAVCLPIAISSGKWAC